MKREGGYTLIELMIGLLVGLIVLSSVIYIFLVTLRTSKDVLNSTRLNMEISGVTDLMDSEIRRAGYWYITPAAAASGSAVSPFEDDGSSELDLLVNGDCVLFAYDRGNDQTIDANERGGFRRKEVASSIGALEYRSSISTAISSTHCADSPDWRAITDSNFLNVTSFAVSSPTRCSSVVSGACTPPITDPTVNVRYVAYYLAAELVKDNEWQSTVSSAIKVRNNLVHQ